MSDSTADRFAGAGKKVDLSAYDNRWYHPGAGKLRQVLWYLVNAWIFKRYWLPSSRLKVFLLRAFGAQVGKQVVIKPCVNIKYPWRLKIGDHCWIGEEVWIDNLAEVALDAHVCLSQGAMLLTGNHDYQRTTFDLRLGEIRLEAGVWVGARGMICPGVVGRTHAVLFAQSVAVSELEAYTIYQGNPAKPIRKRVVS